MTLSAIDEKEREELLFDILAVLPKLGTIHLRRIAREAGVDPVAREHDCYGRPMKRVA